MNMNIRKRLIEIFGIIVVCALTLWLTGAWPMVTSFVWDVFHGG